MLALQITMQSRVRKGKSSVNFRKEALPSDSDALLEWTHSSVEGSVRSLTESRLASVVSIALDAGASRGGFWTIEPLTSCENVIDFVNRYIISSSPLHVGRVSRACRCDCVRGSRKPSLPVSFKITAALYDKKCAHNELMFSGKTSTSWTNWTT